jgi:hypothetical protein
VTKGCVGCSDGEFLAWEGGSHRGSVGFYGTADSASWRKKWVGGGEGSTVRS